MSTVQAVEIATPLLALAGITGAYIRERSTSGALRAELERLRREAAQTSSFLRQRTELDSVKDEFISTVSHELRTPLTSIRGALGLLSAGLMGKVDDKAANLLRIASSNTDRLVRLINDILDLERMASGNAPVRLRPCRPREIIALAIETMSAMAMEADVTLEWEPASQAHNVEFEGDPDRLLQVLTNLLSNAIKFSPRGSTVLVTTSATPLHLAVQVEDAGRGIPEEKLETIFGRFTQVDPADSRQKGGTGLGLAICRSIVQQHGGDIWAERNDHRTPDQPGTRFTFRLPRTAEAAASGTSAQSPETLLRDGAEQHQSSLDATQSGALQQPSSSIRLPLCAASPDLPLSLAGFTVLDLCLPSPADRRSLLLSRFFPNSDALPVVKIAAVGSALAAWAPGWARQVFHPACLLAELHRALHGEPREAVVLLLESDPALAAVLVAGLAGPRSALQVHHAGTAAEALHHLTCQAPAVLLANLALLEGPAALQVAGPSRTRRDRTPTTLVYSSRPARADEIEAVLCLGSTPQPTKARSPLHEIRSLVTAMVRHSRKPDLIASGRASLKDSILFLTNASNRAPNLNH